MSAEARAGQATGPMRTPKTIRRFPRWMRRRVPARGRRAEVAELLEDLGLETVCTSARCPNRCECFARGTATFLILGPRCTRSCRFCAVPGGEPRAPRPDEPEAVAEACARLQLKHVVITMVTRDDLPDGGAGHFAQTVRAVRGRLSSAAIEVLTSDFAGSRAAVRTVLRSGPDVFGHNVETVARLYPTVRPRAVYRRSLAVLSQAARHVGPAGGPRFVKSGLMLGLGERPPEVRRVLADLRSAGCRVLTLGQYLAPTPTHVPVARFVPPGEFEAWRAEALAMGFDGVAAGPFVRSSYMAESLLRDCLRNAK